MASDEHHVGTSAGVGRCRSIWRRPEKERWDRKMLTEMNGEPWNPVPPKDKAPQVHGVYITMERQIKYGGTKGCTACFGQAKVHSPECRAPFQDIVDNKTATVSASEPNVETPEEAEGGPRPVQVVAQYRLRVDPRRRTSTWEQQKAWQHSRRVLWIGRWRLRTTEVQNVRG